MMIKVRTTITLDPDVESLLKKAMERRGVSFKQAVNSAIRAGLLSRANRSAAFEQKTFAMGAEQHFRWDKALAEAGALEDEEIARKLMVGK